MTEDTFFWLFSTIAQTYGAILGVIGMLTVYKFQILSNKLMDVFRRADTSTNFTLSKMKKLTTHKQLVEWWENDEWRFSGYNTNYAGIVETAVQDIKNVNKIKKNISINFKLFFKLFFAIIICSIFVLPFSKILPVFSRTIIISITFILLFISFLITYRLSMSLLEE